MPTTKSTRTNSKSLKWPFRRKRATIRGKYFRNLLRRPKPPGYSILQKVEEQQVVSNKMADNLSACSILNPPRPSISSWGKRGPTYEISTLFGQCQESLLNSTRPFLLLEDHQVKLEASSNSTISSSSFSNSETLSYSGTFLIIE